MMMGLCTVSRFPPQEHISPISMISYMRLRDLKIGSEKSVGGGDYESNLDQLFLKLDTFISHIDTEKSLL